MKIKIKMKEKKKNDSKKNQMPKLGIEPRTFRSSV